MTEHSFYDEEFMTPLDYELHDIDQLCNVLARLFPDVSQQRLQTVATDMAQQPQHYLDRIKPILEQ